MTNLTLKQVASNHISSNTEITTPSRDALIAEFLQFKEIARAKYNSVLSDTLTMQESLRNTVFHEYSLSLFKQAEKSGVLGHVFPQIDLSFLARHSEPLPQWALFDVNGPDTFQMFISFKLGFYGGLTDIHSHTAPSSFAWLFGHTWRNHYSADRIPSELELRGHLEKFVKREFGDGKRFEVKTETGKTLTLKGQANKLNALCHAAPCIIQICLHSTFNHFVPKNITTLINDFRECFERVFFVAEVKEWNSTVLSVVKEDSPQPDLESPASTTTQAGDPLVIGERAGQYYLLGDFDLTDAESYIRREFTF